jgi:hypothetical protein
MNRQALAFLALAAVVAGCVGGPGHARLKAQEQVLMQGLAISDQMERIPRSAENVAVTSAKAEQAVLTQPKDAPGPVSESPLALDAVAKNLLQDIRAASQLADGELTYDEMAKLAPSASAALLHARELVTVFDRRATDARIAAEILTRKKAGGEAAAPQDAELAALIEWVTVAERVERSAEWFNRGVATRSPDLVRKGWAALLDAGRQLPQIRPDIDMMTIKKPRGR